MRQSPFDRPLPGLHVAMIMDGNGRWAVARGQPRLAGHRVGAKVVRRIVEVAPDLGIGTLTLYAFSSDNWSRPPREVGGLMRLFRAYLASETARCVQNGVRLNVIGRRDRLPKVLREAIEASEEKTRDGRRLLLRIAIDYSAREAIMEAGRLAAEEGETEREGFAALMRRVIHSLPASEVDLLVRTGGEQRLSDFLLWESAYAELLFEPTMWPDYTPERLRAAVAEFEGRDRRYGGLSRAAS
ncbi:MAG TPA: di-trans,poly-cis-decaprenylcistransferase [Armatimonadota bacterium]|nr:di-trans,poly-cis-decaprenylcistransferase [Armatimonadota bacterium]